MSASACTFSDLLARTARLCGLDTATLPLALAQDLASFLEARVRDAWVLAQWPDTIVLEERAYAPQLDLTAYYELDDVVYDAASGRYHIAIADSFSGQPVESELYWDVLEDYDRRLLLAEEGEPEMGEILGIWHRHPLRYPGTRPAAGQLLAGEVWLDPQAPATVWVQYRRPAPLFSAISWDGAVTYLAGDAAFLTPHTYKARAASTGRTPPDALFWEPQSCPAVLADYAARGAHADWLTSDGQHDKAAAQEALARGWLHDRLADLVIHQGQSARYSVTPP